MVWLAALAALPGAPVFAQDAPACDRKCLEGFVDRFLEALVAHDHSRVPFAPGAKYTENGQRLSLQQGLWKTASRDSTYRLYFADPANGQVGFIGVLEENGAPVIVSLRLKVAAALIAEAETIAARVQPGDTARVESFKAPLPVLVGALARDARVPRDVLVAAADAYFTGLDTEDRGDNVPFAGRCQRRENGVVTASSRERDASPMARLGCKEQLDMGFSAFVTNVRERRYPIVDEERGLVYAIAFFDHAGNVESYTRPDGTVVPVSAELSRPLTFMIGELFRIEKGLIRHIEAVRLEVPYGMPSGW